MEKTNLVPVRKWYCSCPIHWAIISGPKNVIVVAQFIGLLSLARKNVIVVAQFIGLLSLEFGKVAYPVFNQNKKM